MFYLNCTKSSDHLVHFAVWIRPPTRKNPIQLISVTLHCSTYIGSSTSFECELVGRVFEVSHRYHGILFRVVWQMSQTKMFYILSTVVIQWWLTAIFRCYQCACAVSVAWTWEEINITNVIQKDKWFEEWVECKWSSTVMYHTYPCLLIRFRIDKYNMGSCYIKRTNCWVLHIVSINHPDIVNLRKRY